MERVINRNWYFATNAKNSKIKGCKQRNAEHTKKAKFLSKTKFFLIKAHGQKGKKALQSDLLILIINFRAQ